MKKYYSLTTSGSEADVYIFGDITSWEYFENDVSSYTLSKELQGLDVDVINIHINSYGGEVAEGLAIYNMLRNHKAKIRTYCDGFACSIASVIFMAGDERLMNSASMLFIHNAWTYASGNSTQLRKEADDLDVINQGSVAAYMHGVNITEDELKTMLDAETWILPSDALEMGFATSIVGADTSSNKAAASAKKALYNLVKKASQHETAAPPPPADPPQDPPPAGTPQENKMLKFFNALTGRKE
jgi:ATP-dependent Clp protease protease subunit